MRSKERPTGSGIRAVASLAGVSVSTVSRVLNERERHVPISPATIERVRAAAAALRYRPNASARGLRTTRTQTIGVIMQDLLHPFSAEFLRTIYGVCQARNYHVLVGHAEQNQHESVVLGDILSPDRVDGLLLIGDVLEHAADEEEMQDILRMHQHVVSVGCRPCPAVTLSISIDNAAGVEMALHYLAGLGHRSIAFIGSPPETTEREPWESQQRRDAYRRFVSAHGLHVWELVATDDLAVAQDDLRRLVIGPERPTAAFAINDWTAVMTLKAALTSGICVPDDLSVVGFDDIAFARLYTPGLTTIHQPLDAMGRYATNALLDTIAGLPRALPEGNVEVSGANVIFAPTLIQRESCAAPRAFAGRLSLQN